MRKLTPFLRGVVIAGLLAAGSHAASAAWSATGTGPGDAASSTMPAGNPPTGLARAATVSLSWTAATLPDGTPVAGYTIQRYNAAGGSAATVGGTCVGVVTATSCAEAVPPGTWTYTDTPVQLSWSGSPSGPSGPITVALS
jgi:hypothetical protein